MAAKCKENGREGEERSHITALNMHAKEYIAYGEQIVLSWRLYAKRMEEEESKGATLPQ